ncbi:hypothetical protein HDU98_004246 [Podochytrium sp. JEL0797]|nr:hypothetical protein HDU98_004246 [Podochytrium sp. JEL0797]
MFSPISGPNQGFGQSVPYSNMHFPQQSYGTNTIPARSMAQPAHVANRLTPMGVMNSSGGTHSFMNASLTAKPTLNDNQAVSEKRREYRKEAEKNRRNQLKHGFDTIKELIPTAGKAASKEKLLELAFDHISELQTAEKEKVGTIEALEEQISALKGKLDNN